jgi:DNA polymerase III epsilon subunit-like protein
MFFVFDTETSGLPQCQGWRFPYYKDLAKYDTARIVSISWVILNEDFEEIDKQTHLIKPEGFIIPESSIAIHGITNERAHAEGMNIGEFFGILEKALVKAKCLVAHNINFDDNVLKSECFRYGQRHIVDYLYKMTKKCTMQMGKEILCLPKNPKLSELYETLYGEPMQNAHDAEYDTFYCCQCFKALTYIPKRPKNMDKKKDRGKRYKQSPSDEQTYVINADINKSMLVIACAGSGKSVTIVNRIKYLIQQGVSPETIMLTTFTRDAVADIEEKIVSIIGYRPGITVGTIDSIALRIMKQYDHNKTEDASSGDYSKVFLEFLKSNPDIISQLGIKYLFIDEFQDINDIQYHIFKRFYNKGVILTAVGDDAQNIYTFRGSNVKYILNFKEHFPESNTYTLTTNFRSSHPIVEFANATIEKNDFQYPKRMCAYNQSAAVKPKVEYFKKSSEQYDYIVSKIADYTQKGYSRDEIAVLCPQNSFLFQLEEHLSKHAIPFVLLEGQGDSRVKSKEDHVCLSTIHKAKGLEWDIVFLLMMNDEVFPARKEQDDIYESRRLFYVGVTRPCKILHITYSPIRGCHFISRFVSEIPNDLYNTNTISRECIGHSYKDFVTKTADSKTEHLQQAYIIKKNSICHIINWSNIKKSFPKTILDNDYINDYNAFWNAIVQKMICDITEAKSLLVYRYALYAICSAKLDMTENYIYNKYRVLFELNINNVYEYMQEYTSNVRKIMSCLLESQSTSKRKMSIDSGDVSIILSILRKIYHQSKKYNIPMNKIPIFTERFLPQDYENKLVDNMTQYSDPQSIWINILPNIWEVSKCRSIVENKRRRMLYKAIDFEELKFDMDFAKIIYKEISRLFICNDMSDTIYKEDIAYVNGSVIKFMHTSEIANEHFAELVKFKETHVKEPVSSFKFVDIYNGKTYEYNISANDMI